MKDFNHGDKVSFLNRLSRCNTKNDKGIYIKNWDISKYRKARKESGIYLGLRTVQSGYTEFDSEYGAYFIRTGSKQVALVSINTKENPVYVEIDELMSKNK